MSNAKTPLEESYLVNVYRMSTDKKVISQNFRGENLIGKKVAFYTKEGHIEIGEISGIAVDGRVAITVPTGAEMDGSGRWMLVV